MKLAFFSAAGLIAAILVNAAPAATFADKAKASAAGLTQLADEISAAKKRRVFAADIAYVDAITGEIVNPYRPRYVAPSHDFIGGPDGYPGEYAARRAAGQCVMDFGYGRWQAC